MKGLKPYISSFIIAVFIFSTVLQFHHHDANGSLDLLNFHEETCLVSHRTCHVERTDAHSHHHDSNGDECCTLKLSVQKRTPSISVPEIFSSVTNHFVTDIISLADSICCQVEEHVAFPIFKTIGFLSDAITGITHLRAPPFIS